MRHTCVLGRSKVTLVESFPRLTSTVPDLLGSIDSGLKLSAPCLSARLEANSKRLRTPEGVKILVGEIGALRWSYALAGLECAPQ
jgi:hypothetical protein